MIARLKGHIAELGLDHVVLDVTGVGYLAYVSGRTLSGLGSVGAEAMLLTEMQVREDAITLFGFATVVERDWFRLLTGVQGVGSRLALAILSVLEPADLQRAVAGGDKAMIARANGVGPKLAQRIAMELKDKAGPALPGRTGAAGGAAPVGGIAEDALSALVNLGFRAPDATAAIAAAHDELGPDVPLDRLVRTALRKASRA